MELPTICFVFPYLFIGISIILHIAIFLLILKFVPNVEKLPFLWGMINWTIAIGVIFIGVGYFLPLNSDNLKLLKAFIGGIVPPITEDIGRFIVFSFIYKSKNHNFNNSLIFGAGHGGWESICLLLISYIPLLLNFNAIKNAKNEEELIEKKLFKTYEHYKNGVPSDEIFGIITRFLGNLFHMAASIIIYRLALNRKEKKYIIYFIVLFISHFANDLTAQLMSIYELSLWFNFVFVGLVLVIIVIAWFAWKENNNKEYSDYNYEKKNGMIAMDDYSVDRIS